MARFKKFIRVILKCLLFILIFGIVTFLWALFSVPVKEPKFFGVTYVDWISEKYGMDKREVYLAILDELEAKRIRLPLYWNRIEKADDMFDFSESDWQLLEADKRGTKIILNIGRKTPRWPECHQPDWVSSQKSEDFEKKELLEFLRVTVEHYKDHGALYAWQVENEPFLPFGKNCPLFGAKFLDEELALVRGLDKSHPVIVTDSGELSLWFRAEKRADIFGTTMYRTVWQENLGYYTYPIPPSFFRLKRFLSEIIAGPRYSIVSELQAEPWGPDENYKPENFPIDEQWKNFNDETFREHIEYAKRTGFDEFYLWGVEWWYWIRLQGHPEIWEEAKTLF